MIAVVPRDAARVDVEADARVRVDSGAEVRDAVGDVVDALENGRASSRGAGAEDMMVRQDLQGESAGMVSGLKRKPCLRSPLAGLDAPSYPQDLQGESAG